MQDIKKLIRGYKRFQQNYFKDDIALFDRLRHGQNPKVLLIGCSDSRVDPAILTGCQPGDLFVVRNVANLIPPYERGRRHDGVSPAIEYAVRILGVEHVIVMGHSQCGGIGALMRSDTDSPVGEFIDPWVDIAKPAKEKVLKEWGNKPFDIQVRACEQVSVTTSLENLLTFPWVAQQVKAGKLSLHGWYFDLETGQMLGYQPETGEFESIGK